MTGYESSEKLFCSGGVHLEVKEIAGPPPVQLAASMTLKAPRSAVVSVVLKLSAENLGHYKEEWLFGDAKPFFS